MLRGTLRIWRISCCCSFPRSMPPPVSSDIFCRFRIIFFHCAETFSLLLRMCAYNLVRSFLRKPFVFHLSVGVSFPPVCLKLLGRISNVDKGSMSACTAAHADRWTRGTARAQHQLLHHEGRVLQSHGASGTLVLFQSRMLHRLKYPA